MDAPSAAAATSPRGSAWCLIRQPPAVGRSCWGSPSAAADTFASSSSRAPERHCRRWPGRRRRSAAGYAACSLALMATPSSWRWRASSSGSPGRSCATRPGSSPAAQQWRRTGSAGGDHPTSQAVQGLRVVEARWPDSQPVSQKPMPSNGTRCRPLYQDRDARISILARVEP